MYYSQDSSSQARPFDLGNSATEVLSSQATTADHWAHREARCSMWVLGIGRSFCGRRLTSLAKFHSPQDLLRENIITPHGKFHVMKVCFIHRIIKNMIQKWSSGHVCKITYMKRKWISCWNMGPLPPYSSLDIDKYTKIQKCAKSEILLSYVLRK